MTQFKSENGEFKIFMTSRWTRRRTWTKRAFLLCVQEMLKEGRYEEATLRAQARTARQESPGPREPVSLLPVEQGDKCR